MSQLKTRAEFDSLQSIFADVAANAGKDPIERIVVLTYEFDDQQLINLISGRRLDDEFDLLTNHLRFIAACQPLILYDARKTRESNKLPHFLDLIPVRASAYSCHHSKAYLIVTANTVRLVFGSFNLTRTGLFSNREVFMDFMWSSHERANLGLLHSFAELLRNGYKDQQQAIDSAALDSVVNLIAARVDEWSGGSAGTLNHGDSYTMLASGYNQGETGMRQLARLWRTISDRPPCKLVAVSPFFDRGSSFLVDMLNAELGAIPEIEIHTDAANVAALSKRHFGPSAAVRRLHLIPTEICSAELSRIEAANDGASIGDLNIHRKLHAKILVLCAHDQTQLVYIGSANFTRKAWNGDNHELGLAWVQKGNANTLVASIRRALGSANDCAFATLPDALEETEHEEDALYEGGAGYPDFIRDIELRTSDGLKTVFFHFNCDQPERLLDYDVYWGDVLVSLSGTTSRAIQWGVSTFPLLGKRNLCFVRRGFAGQVFYLPFHHAAEMLAYSDLRLFVNAEDWLQHYLRPAYAGGGGPGERMPGEPPESDDAADMTVDRESNLVIAMQRHLSLFAEVERVFEAKIADVAGRPDCSVQWARHVEKPLLLYAQLLEKEREASTSMLREQVYSFKLGELALFCQAMGARLPVMSDLARRLASSLVPRPSDPDALRIYLDFCRSELN